MDDAEERLGAEPGFIAGTIAPGSSPGTNYAQGNFTFTGRPVMIVIQPGSSISIGTSQTALTL